MTLSFLAQNLFLIILPCVAFFFFFRIDYTDSPLILLSISIFFFFSFSVFHFLVVGAVD